MRHWDLWVEVPGAAVSVTCDSRDRGMLNETRGPPLGVRAFRSPLLRSPCMPRICNPAQ